MIGEHAIIGEEPKQENPQKVCEKDDPGNMQGERLFFRCSRRIRPTPRYKISVTTRLARPHRRKTASVLPMEVYQNIALLLSTPAPMSGRLPYAPPLGPGSKCKGRISGTPYYFDTISSNLSNKFCIFSKNPSSHARWLVNILYRFRPAFAQCGAPRRFNGVPQRSQAKREGKPPGIPGGGLKNSATASPVSGLPL